MSKYFTTKHVAKQFGIAPSARYATFLDTKQWKSHDKKFSLVPTYEKPMKIGFSGAPLESFFTDDDVDDAHPYSTEVTFANGWVPLATIGSEEAQFLAVRATDAACPVAMWEHETGTFVPVAESLDGFLEALGTTAKAAKEPVTAYDMKKLRATMNGVEKLVDARASKKRDAELATKLGELQALLVDVPATLQGDDASAARMATYRVGQALRSLKRYREAVEIFRQPGVAQDSAVELLVDELDDAAGAIAICETQDSPGPSLRNAWGLALFRIGRIDEASDQLRWARERQVDATLKLSPKKDRTAEMAKRTEAITERIAAFATKHGLDATTLLAKLS